MRSQDAIRRERKNLRSSLDESVNLDHASYKGGRQKEEEEGKEKEQGRGGEARRRR